METTVQKKLWLSSPHMGGNEQKYVQQAFDENWIAPLGPNVDAFEDTIQEFYDNNVHVACLSSGTASIHLGLKLLGVGPNDLVLCQSFTFSASANPIVYLGAKPIFIDSEKDTWNISPILLEKAIVELMAKGQKPKAIVAVHLYGMPYNVEAVNKISAQYDIPVLEDSAEALGSTYHGAKCGSFGDIAILSFNGNKIITTSGGGALLSKNKAHKDKAIFLATQARDSAPHYQHTHIGHNYRMSNVLAGIGRGQMEVLHNRVEARRRNFEIYKSSLADVRGISFLIEPDSYFANRWLTTVLFDTFHIKEKVRLALAEENIEARPLWKPMHLQPIFSETNSYVNGVSEDLFNRGLCLPSGSNLELSDLNRVITIITRQL